MESLIRGIQSDHLDTSSPKPKRRKLSHPSHQPHTNSPRNKRWRTDAERRVYSTKLVEALRRSLRTSATVRDTADRVLASAAKGTTRWSRAILARRSTRMRMRTRRMRVRKVTGLLKRKEDVDNRRLPPVQKRLRVLSRLVPGCRKVTSFSSLLEEATDYISALEMQVKAMAALTEILSAGA